MKKKREYVSVDTAKADAAHYPKMPTKSAVQRAGHELKKNPPAVVEQTRRKKGRAAARRQAVAIMLSKARRGS